MQEDQRLWIICPTFFDVKSFKRVRTELLQSLQSRFSFSKIQFCLIDDSAGQDPEIQALSDENVIIAPPYNLGHQGALVYGLRSLGEHVRPEDYILTLDSDGEDRPEDAPQVLALLLEDPGNLHAVSAAQRTHRTENLPFKLLYICFKRLFLVLTGTVIKNGNFIAFRGWLLKEVIYHPHFDQAYASTFISLPLRIRFAPLPRGPRYFGKSKMGYTGLITHGFRMLMPFSEKIATRGIVASGAFLFADLVAAVLFMNHGTFLIFLFFALYFTATLGIFSLLFVTFSQTKSRSLRGMHELRRVKNES